MTRLLTLAVTLALAALGYGTGAAPPGTSAPHRPTAGPDARRSVPPVSAAARRAGLVDVRTVVPDAIVDLRYATKTTSPACGSTRATPVA
jgi:D-alanyl-D-alanine dipeptidase